MSPTPSFRRPAPLYPSVADAIPGAPDPAQTADLAHQSAEALLHGVFHSADEDVVQRVLTLVEREGLGDLATLWSAAPATSLPGALWRLYVLHTWVQRQTEEVTLRYREGSRTVPGLRYLAGLEEPPSLEQTRSAMDLILRGAFTGDLSVALARAGAVAVIAAHGTAHLADSESTEAAQRELTVQAERLLTTGEELAAAGHAARHGTLD
ncbi:hypothetical protein [Brachybacterium phenoliresistens]|uniref:DNA-directed RNA polymerase subunit beta n=1 Tax=Brachybacterium phenoliresistens TaxID=396014 RepID=Z9JUM1_9MICO|nr:hypothetical protein [Brachybacterium phenoliresistens]EWS81462.1 hypothetical protein BF93_16790 [Brachybacterium phenoliresistens]